MKRKIPSNMLGTIIGVVAVVAVQMIAFSYGYGQLTERVANQSAKIVSIEDKVERIEILLNDVLKNQSRTMQTGVLR